jgi:predicted O-linked N-acetylglucosamine transferase (SPINDLY family)
MNVETAFQMFAAGNIYGAEQAYRGILSQNANNYVALEKLALICMMTGRVDEAQRLMLSALRLNPKNVETHANLAVAYKSQGRLKEAIASNRKAIELGGEIPEIYLNLGEVLKDYGRPEEAISAYEKALALKPNLAEAHNNLGVVLLTQGKLDDALARFQKAVQMKPTFGQAHHNLGMVLLKLNRFEESVAPCQSAVELLPSPETYFNLATSLFRRYSATGNTATLSDALAAYNKTLSLKPDYAEAYQNLGTVFRDLDRVDEAVAAYNKAIQLKPEQWANYTNLGLMLQKQAQNEEAAALFERALLLQCQSLSPGSRVESLGRYLLQLLRLPIIYSNATEIDRSREAFTSYLQKASALVTELKRPFNREELSCLRWLLFSISNFFLGYQQRNDRELQTTYANLALEVLKPELSDYLSCSGERKSLSNRKIRLGLASEHLRFHHGSCWAYGWLTNLPKDDYEFFLYSLNGQIDEITQRFAMLGTFRWLSIHSADVSYLQSLKTIKDDNLDVLLFTDVGMSPISRVLSLTRLAPIQCTAWGHPVTTGSPNIDYFLSSELMEPELSDNHYSEKLVRLPNIGVCLEYPDDAQSIGDRSSFGIPLDRTIYGSVQSLFKYLPQFDFIFPTIAKRVPDAFFVLVADRLEHVTTMFRERLRTCFDDHGVSFEQHVKILPRMSQSEFMQLLSVLDINLDSIGFTGGMTAMRSLAMDCPPVTMRGEFMRGRLCASMLEMIGLTELITDSLDEYIELSCNIGLDKQLRSSIVDKIKSNKQKLFDDKQCADYLDKFLKTKLSEQISAFAANSNRPELFVRN